jgi:CHAT domain-containing protein
MRFMPKYCAALLITALVCVSFYAKGQSNNTTLAEADRLAMLYNWPRAIPLYVKAQSEFRSAGDKEGELEARLGWIQAEAYQEPSEALADEVQAGLDNPAVRATPTLMLRCLVAKGTVEEQVNENSSRVTWEKVQKLAGQLKDRRWQARAQAELGEIDFLDGNVAAATANLKAALITMYLNGDMGGAIYYGSIVGNGLVEAGQPEKGIVYCQTAINNAPNIKDLGFPFMAYEGEARGLIALHQYAAARKVLDRAIGEAQKQAAFAAEAQLLVVRGQDDMATNPLRSIQELQQATAFSREHDFRHVLAWATFELATAYREQGQLALAQRYAALAERRTEGVNDKYHLPEDLALLADLAAEAGHVKQAERLYARAEDVTNGLLLTLPSRQVEGSLMATLSNVYLGHFRLTALELNNLSQAFGIIESARGRAMADQLRSGAQIELPKDRITQGAQQELNRLQIQLLHETSASKRTALLQRLFEVEQVLGPAGGPPTSFQRATLQAAPAKLPDVQRQLNGDTAILEYVLDSPSSFCLYITHGSAGLITLPASRAELDKLVASYRKLVRTRIGTIAGAHTLYADLIEPLPPQALKRRLIIVPDGSLNLIPFDALTDSSGHYVLDAHVVTYTPSATVLRLIGGTKRVNTNPITFLGVGGVEYGVLTADASPDAKPAPDGKGGTSNPFDPKAEPLRDLSGSRDEVTAAGKVFGGSSVLLLGRNATKVAFMDEPLGRFKIIHIAAHGVDSPIFPDRAALVLGEDPEHHDDGLLQVRDIERLHLNAELVTLSACDTGAGRLEGEEGIENIERAFLFAGARSVLASLWTASDVYTTELMGQFYRNLATGEDEGDALRKAKLALLKEYRSQATPFYWAGFTLVGAVSASLETRRNYAASLREAVFSDPQSHLRNLGVGN